MRDHNLRLVLMLCAAMAATSAAAPASIDAGPPAGEESVAVDLRTVPFYAIDAEGKPVFDLRAEELELRVDGKPQQIDTFDRHRLDGARGRSSGDTALPPPARDVYLAIDQAFLSMPGLSDAQQMARAAIANFLPSDRLFVVVNDAESGFRMVLGPVPGDAAGKERVRARIAKLRPSVGRLGTDTDLPPMVLGTGRNGVPKEQVHNMHEAAGALIRAEYRDAAEGLAQSLRLFGLQLARTSTPKAVVLFTAGLDRGLYFEGEVGFIGVGSGGTAESAHMDTRRAGPMVAKFRPAFSALAASGANLYLVNPDSGRQSGHEYLEQFREEVGGVLLDHASPTRLAGELQASTSALYVAGFYAHPEAPLNADATVEVVVRRTGVRALAPHGIRSPRPWSALDSTERRLAVLDLVQRGVYTPSPGAQPEVPARPIAARVVGASTDRGKGLQLIGEWPSELAGHKVEVYDVLMRTAGGEDGPELIAFHESSLQAPTDPLEVKMSMVPGTLMWAVVLVEPGSGAAYLRRLSLSAPKTATR